MDNLLVGMLSLPQFPAENSLPSVMSSATSFLWKTFRDPNHRCENRDQVITISSESVIIFPRNPDHDHPGIVITIARNRRSPSPGIRSRRRQVENRRELSERLGGFSSISFSLCDFDFH
jgi:hypothetical protein